MNTTTEFQLVDIDKLVPYANNARTHNKEQILKLRSSLREFGFVNPVIIDREYNVLAGHGRIEAAKAENISEVPCVFADHLTEAQKKAYILADNRMALDAGWDEELLAVEMEELQNLGFDLGLTGFDETEIADLFDTNSGDTVKDDDFDLTTALEKAAFVQRGDIWTVGRHKLMCGDATSAEDVSALMGDTKANLILTDPPYGVSFKSASGLTIQNDSMKNEEFYTFLLSSFQRMAEHLEKGGSAYVFHADTEGLNFRKAFIDAGFHLAGCCIWVKDSLLLPATPDRFGGLMVVKGYPFQKGFDCMKKFYLAYGSNLNVKQMQFRCPDARIVGIAEIPNYQLLFKGSKTGSYLTIEPKQGCTVPAAVWSVSERDELALDRYEGYPHFYYKTELELPLAETGKKLTAFVYIMHEERKLGIPTSAYIRTCVDGYRQFGFDLKHLRKAVDISEREVYHHENG